LACRVPGEGSGGGSRLQCGRRGGGKEVRSNRKFYFAIIIMFLSQRWLAQTAGCPAVGLGLLCRLCVAPAVGGMGFGTGSDSSKIVLASTARTELVARFPETQLHVSGDPRRRRRRGGWGGGRKRRRVAAVAATVFKESAVARGGTEGDSNKGGGFQETTYIGGE